MIVQADNREFIISKIEWVLQYEDGTFVDCVTFLKARCVKFFDPKLSTTALSNWMCVISVSASREVLAEIYFLRAGAYKTESKFFLITGSDANDFIEILKKRWKNCIEKLEALDSSTNPPKPESVKTKTDPPPEIKLPKNDFPYPYRE